MNKRFIPILVCSVLGLIGAIGPAGAETIGRYQCQIVGNATAEALGDRTGHGLTGYQFSCVGVDGLLKGAVYSAINVAEWDGPQATFLLAGGVHRSAGGFAVTQMLEGTGVIAMKDGKPAGSTSSGKALIKLASGTLAPLAGKTVKFASKSTGLNQFELEFID